jgi:hypothetical protein
MRQAPWWLPAALLLCAAPAAAQDKTVEGKGPPNPPIPVIKLKLHPAAAPVPALKYTFLPELRDLKPGNAVFLYYRSFSPEWQYNVKKPDFWKTVEKWQEDPAKAPPAELKFVLFDHALKEIDLAARRTYCDWELLDRIRKDGIGTLLPDIQSFRTSIILLKARARFEMLDKKLDQALYTLQTGFTFARHVSDGPTLIQSLVGNAMTAQMIEEVEQLIQQPGAPNLYWALTDLPHPFIDLKKPLQGEKIVIDSLFPGWRDVLYNPEVKPPSPQQWDDFLDKTFHIFQSYNIAAAKSFDTKLELALIAAKTYPEARKFLLAQGRSKQQVDKMPVTQVALLYEIYNYDRFYDDFVKWYGLPYPQMVKGSLAAVNQLKTAKATMQPGTALATLLLPAVQKVYDASYRTDRKFALLRTVEALRIYAAAHDGKLPATLKDIHEVPVPIDPFTGNFFEYTVADNTATLTAGIPSQGYAYGSYWTFDITMQP